MNGLLALAFAAGMLAPVNPCGFALLPAWFIYAIGDADSSPVPVRLARSLRAGAALTLGFVGTLALVGIAVSAGAHAVIGAAPWLGLAVGVALVLVGTLMLIGRNIGLRRPAIRRAPRTGPPSSVRMLAFGVGYATASLSCTFGVLLAVIAQAQATATFAGLLTVFAAYALGSATILLLVAISTAAAGAVLLRRLAPAVQHANRITAVVLLATGAYLAWYWYPSATGDGSRGAGATRASAAAAEWLQGHTAGVALLSGTVVLTVITAAAIHRHRSRTPTSAHRNTTMTRTSRAASSSCCAAPAEPDQPADRTDATYGSPLGREQAPR